MAVLLDPDVLIHLREGDPEIADRAAALNDSVLMSIVSRLELEGGVWRDPGLAPVRRARLDVILAAVPALAFDVEAPTPIARSWRAQAIHGASCSTE